MRTVLTYLPPTPDHPAVVCAAVARRGSGPGTAHHHRAVRSCWIQADKCAVHPRHSRARQGRGRCPALKTSCARRARPCGREQQARAQVLVADDASLAHNLAEPAAALLADVQRRRATRPAPHSSDVPCCVRGMEPVLRALDSGGAGLAVLTRKHVSGKMDDRRV
jgi:hypothetical protein